MSAHPISNIGTDMTLSDVRAVGPALVPEAEKLDPRVILAVIVENARLIAAIIGGSVVVALAATLLTTPRYTAQVRVQINDQTAPVLGKDVDISQTEATSPMDTDRFLRTQMDILSSRGMAERVARRLNLIGNPKFYAAMGKRAPADGLTRAELKDDAIELLLDGEYAELPRETRLARINFTSISPSLSARIANAWANEFIQANLQRRFDSSAYARDFISGQLAEAKSKLEQSERDLNRYARNSGIIRTRVGNEGLEVAGGNANSVTTASLLQLNASANQAETARIAIEQRWRALSSGALLNSPDVLGNATISALLADRAKAEAELQRESAKHLEDHPSVQQFKSQLAAIDRQINQVARSIQASVKQQYDTALQAENGLKQQVQHLTGSSLAEQDRSVQYSLMAREADTNRSLYEGLLQRYKELNAAAGITMSNIAIIDSADDPIEPSSPKLLRNLAMALVAGIALATAVVFLRKQFDDAVRVPEDVEAKLNLALLGVIPKVPAGEIADALIDPKSAVSEAINSLRSALMFATANGLPSSILFTSSQASEGKSTTSLAIARGVARLGKSVVLLDLDLRRPALHAVAGLDNKVGMSSVLTRLNTLDEALRPTNDPNLMIITSGPLPPSPTELLSSERMKELLAELNSRFDLVVFDTPPILGLADAPMLSGLVSAVVVVIEADRNRRGSLRTSMNRLRAMNPNIVGAVLTKFDPSKSGNRYSDYYGYNYYQYKSGDKI